MEKGTTFTSNNATWKINEIMETSANIRQLGWTHFASVSRPNGRKTYYANLVVENGQILHSLVVC
jgi:hypothetical protein